MVNQNIVSTKVVNTFNEGVVRNAVKGEIASLVVLLLVVYWARYLLIKGGNKKPVAGLLFIAVISIVSVVVFSDDPQQAIVAVAIAIAAALVTITPFFTTYNVALIFPTAVTFSFAVAANIRVGSMPIIQVYGLLLLSLSVSMVINLWLAQKKKETLLSGTSA